MPALPDITLQKGQVLITQSDSSIGLVSVDNTLLFGQVEMVYATSDRITVGNVVMFDSQKAKRIMYGSTIYYLIDDEYVSGQEAVTF